MIIYGLVIVIGLIVCIIMESKYKQLESEIFKELNFSSWNVVSYFDANIIVKSRQTLEKYDDIKYFKENKDEFVEAENVIQYKKNVANALRNLLESNIYEKRLMYGRFKKKSEIVLKNAEAYRVCVDYISSAGNHLGQKEICIDAHRIEEFKDNPALLMGKGEYNKYLKEQQKQELDQKHHDYYEKVNSIVDYANDNRDTLVIKGSQGKLDNFIAQLFDRTVNSIKKIKNIDSEEWTVIGDFITYIENEVRKIVNENLKILDYYESEDFQKIKATCDVMMSSQREFNEYINEKVQSISKLFGTRVVRNETVVDDQNNYIRPYKKTITPFTAEVSATVFASAENSPLEYVVKYFYPNKAVYPEQIQKLQMLVEELETLKDAKQIIENHKQEYRQYISDVPDFIMQNDEAGFYARLGFAYIDESVLTVEYKFSYTSGGGFAQRSFTVPMTEENIVELVQMLESKLTMSSFKKEQRALMTKKLRETIKIRDNYTCCVCGNSTYMEPNLLLEIDHIVPVSKGGYTEENNLQTLCWKCNRSKSDKIIKA